MRKKLRSFCEWHSQNCEWENCEWDRPPPNYSMEQKHRIINLSFNKYCCRDCDVS